jgi:hypothetical protein
MKSSASGPYLPAPEIGELGIPTWAFNRRPRQTPVSQQQFVLLTAFRFHNI